VLPGDRLARVDVQAVLNPLFRQRHIQLSGLPVGADYGDWRDQGSPASKPPASVDHKMADTPSLIVEIELSYRSEFAVGRSDCKILQIRCIRLHFSPR
jgi:hypothetical protein